MGGVAMDRRGFLTSVTAGSVIAPTLGLASARVSAEPAPVHSAHSFPPEWEPHDAVWMGWNDYVDADEAHVKLRLEMIAALTPHVPVRLLVPDEDKASTVATRLSGAGIALDRVDFQVQPTVDVWTRDCGPLFVTDGATKQLAAFRWSNYGYPWPLNMNMARGEVDAEIGARLGLAMRNSEVIAEGGGLDVNSRTLITYRDALWERNAHMSLSEIEAELKRLYGKEQVIWLDRAPITDRVLQGPKVANFFGWGANGHVDEYVRFVAEDTIMVGEVSEAERERDALMRLDHEILTENRRQLEEARDPDGNPFKVLTMPVPDIGSLMRRRTLTEEDFSTYGGRWMFNRHFKPGDEVIDVPAVSYLNFLVTNGVVLSAKYGGAGRPDHLAETDAIAAARLAEAFPDREIVQIDPLAANWDGGGMHCLTQQEPSL